MNRVAPVSLSRRQWQKIYSAAIFLTTENRLRASAWRCREQLCPPLLRHNSRFQGTAPSVICVSLFLLDPAILERMLAHRTEIIASRGEKASRPINAKGRRGNFCANRILGTSCSSQLLKQERSSLTRISSNPLLYHIASFIVLTFVYYIIKFDVKFIFIFGRKTQLINEPSGTVEQWSLTWGIRTPGGT